MTTEKGKGRKQFLLMMALFASPILLAIIMYNMVMEQGPGKTKNHGNLVAPARPLTDVDLTSSTNKPYKFSDMKRKWIMVYIGDSHCDAVCKDVLYKMRQSRLAQQGEHKRIKRLYISTAGKPQASLQQVLKEHPGLEVVYGSAGNIKNVLQQFILQNKAASKDAQRLYLIDPLGNLMMSYEKDFDARGLIKDLTILLKISRIG